jgi:hypothetical protein
MRVLLVHALPLSHRGGAEISLKLHLEQAPAGVAVETALPDEPVDLNRYEVVILANLRPSARPSSSRLQPIKDWAWRNMSRSPLQRFATLSEVAWAKLWRRRLAGYRGYVIKSERDIHPCVYRDARCLQLDPVRRVECGATKAVARAFERLYNFCDAVQFLSPLHQEAINTMLRIKVPQHVIASPLDFELFRNYVPFERRKNAALLTGDAIRESPHAERRASEAGYPVERLPYLSMPYERMPEVLNRYRAVVVDPVMLHAFGRLAAEGLACGCRVLASGRVGALSWPDPLQACREANARFWEMVTTPPRRPNPRRLEVGKAGIVRRLIAAGR